jgi:hypothetical protein
MDASSPTPERPREEEREGSTLEGVVIATIGGFISLFRGARVVIGGL